ncbi:hypothetical protein PsYK624_096610 [Phanerochaete sordida]|uniref:Uncharacterized protein n=1 Tax=Phanerochaete sordida TaxID=48140 RepID=A0A9P3GD31_9APHY|nr:hypothetical protein PsYK624_096610 [Phanerochaete sordida]
MPPSPPPSARANSYYRTPRERELDLAIPTPRKTRAAAQPPPPPHAGSSTAQVLHPAWQPQTRSDERVAASLLSDARAELMLHAARRIGKRRTGALAGLVLRPESAPVTPQEGAKSKGKERAGSRASDKGKGRAHPAEEDVLPVKKQRKRAVKKANTMPKVASSSTAATAPTNASSGYYGTLPGMSHLLYVNPLHTGQRMPAGGALPVFMPLGGWPPAAPGAPGSPQRKPDAPAESSTPARAPPTPGLRRSESAASQGLDSLLSAARMLADDAGPSADGGGGGTPARRAHDLLDTPTPKRRRVEGGTPGSLGDAGAEAGETGDASPRTPTPAGRGRALGRISSALDVLADQAAQEQERRPATPSRPAAAPTSEQRLGRSRGRTRRGKGREAAEGSASRQSSPVRQVSTEPNSSREGTPPPSSIVSVAQQRGGPVVGTRSLPAPSASSANRLAVPVVERAVSSDADAPGSPENSMDVGD